MLRDFFDHNISIFQCGLWLCHLRFSQFEVQFFPYLKRITIKTSCFKLLYQIDITIKLLIKTLTKFLNVIGYHQPDLSTNRTVYVHVTLVIERCNRIVKETVNTSCLCEWTEHVMCTSCFLSFHLVNCFFFFNFMKKFNQCLVSFSNFVIVWLISNRTLCHPILSIIIVIKKNWTPAM